MTTPPVRRRSRSLVALAVVLVAVLIGAIVTAVLRGGGDSGHSVASRSSSPGIPTERTAAAASTIATTYYLAVKAGNVRQAYALLCPGRQRGFDQYAGQVALNTRTGTGIASFRVVAAGSVAGLTAQVPAHVSLTNGTQTPLVVLLTYDAGSWKVCSSDLGGVLPGPGLGLGPTPTQSTPPPKSA